MSGQAPILIVEHDPASPPAMIGTWLGDAGAAYHMLRAHAGEDFPDDLSAYSGVIMLGGTEADPPWRDATMDLIRRVVAESRPLLAICLSAQLLAHALGGLVQPGAEGVEAGPMLTARKDASYDDRLFNVLPMAPDVLQLHHDAIVELPPGAVRLMGGPVYDNQAFRVGTAAWGIGFHIETTPEIYAGWLEQDRDALERDGLDVDWLIDRAAAVHPDLAWAWRPFIVRFAELAAADHASR